MALKVMALKKNHFLLKNINLLKKAHLKEHGNKCLALLLN